MSTMDDLARGLRRRLVEEATRTGLPLGGDRASLRDRVAELVHDQAVPLEGDEREMLVDRVLSSAIGLGPLEHLVDDPSVDEVMVNGHAAVYVERAGRIERTDAAFTSEEALM